MIERSRIPARRARRGISLIEMMVVMSSFAALIGLCAVTMQLLMRVGSDSQARRTTSATIGRLAEQFREDVHDADEAEFRPRGGLRLKHDGRVVDYEVRAGRVARAETTDGQAIRHESYELGRHDAVAFEPRDDGPRRFLAMVIGRGERPGSADPTHPMEVLALLGKARAIAPGSKGGPSR